MKDYMIIARYLVVYLVALNLLIGECSIISAYQDITPYKFDGSYAE